MSFARSGTSDNVLGTQDIERETWQEQQTSTMLLSQLSGRVSACLLEVRERQSSPPPSNPGKWLANTLIIFHRHCIAH